MRKFSPLTNLYADISVYTFLKRKKSVPIDIENLSCEEEYEENRLL